MRVRIPEGYPARFCFDLGQRGVDFSRKKLVRGSRFLKFLDAVTFDSGAGCDLMHTLNAVPVRSRVPYLITFESYLPRVPDDRYSAAWERFLFRRLMRPRCKRLVAFSSYAMRQFNLQVSRTPGTESLLQRTEILYPAIDVRRSKPKELDGRRSLLFVGRQFMHKGGPAVLHAHRALREQGMEVSTTIVSDLVWDPKGLVGPARDETVKSLLTMLDQPGISHHHRLDNAQVLQLMDDADFLLLPTVNDTFGFSCLEALAGAVPVIASNTCALPEIVVEGGNGFLLDMPIDEAGRWTGLGRRRQADYDRLYEELMQDLGRQIAERVLATDANAYRHLSCGALESVQSRFNRASARERLETLYGEALV